MRQTVGADAPLTRGEVGPQTDVGGGASAPPAASDDIQETDS